MTQATKTTLLTGVFALTGLLLVCVTALFISVIGPGRYIFVSNNPLAGYVTLLDRFSGKVRYCYPTRGCVDRVAPAAPQSAPDTPQRQRSL